MDKPFVDDIQTENTGQDLRRPANGSRQTVLFATTPMAVHPTFEIRLTSNTAQTFAFFSIAVQPETVVRPNAADSEDKLSVVGAAVGTGPTGFTGPTGPTGCTNGAPATERGLVSAAGISSPAGVGIGDSESPIIMYDSDYYDYSGGFLSQWPAARWQDRSAHQDCLENLTDGWSTDWLRFAADLKTGTIRVSAFRPTTGAFEFLCDLYIEPARLADARPVCTIVDGHSVEIRAVDE
jgi:hypothetical protein